MNSIIWILAGALIVLSVWLTQFLGQWWLLLSVLVGGYLAVTGYTGRCPVKNFLAKKFGEQAKNYDIIDD